MPNFHSLITATPQQEIKPPAHPRIGLSTVIDETLLKRHWRRIRNDLRYLRPASLYLAYDPLEWLTFDVNLGERVHELGARVLDGSYRANPPEIIRGAKSLGLTRPLAFFDINDLLLYRNIIALMETDLLTEMQPWSRLGRIHSQQDDQNFAAESGWFRAWLRRNSQLWTITENYDCIVETDISNFFPSIHLDTVIDHLLAHSQIGVDASRLLSHMLREFAPVPEYRVSPLVGLPQDSFDCSRVIAHSFLGQVDNEFLEEGKNNGFSRYMDDIVIGSRSLEEGYRLVNRTQNALERLGLYPNTAKTRVIGQREFISDMMKDQNDYIGDIESTFMEGGLVSLPEIQSRLNQHLRLTPRPRGWERVLRRYYALSRRLRIPRLLDVAFEQVGQFPGSARSILDYCATYPLTPRRVERLRTTIDDACSMYEDIQQLALEYLAIAPSMKNRRLSSTICDWMKDVLENEHERNGRLAATACILLAKFGDAPK
jgi:Reverse transcriptase (RNA-dependent DNA polymerase)